jgi:peptide/nickel transport system substrate-binding protein
VPRTTRRAFVAGSTAALLADRVGPARAAGVLRWSSEGVIIGWDPHGTLDDLLTTHMVVGHVYEALTRIGHSLSLEPALATSWRLVEPTVWEFILRPGVRFHDGTPLTPADVVFSLDRSRGEGGYGQATLDTLVRVEATDAGMVRIVTAQPDPVLPTRLRFQAVMSEAWARAHALPQPADQGKAEDSFAHEHANGTGPFRLAESSLPHRFALERNQDWWGLAASPVEASRVEWLQCGGDEERIRAFREGEIDLIFRPPLLRVTELASLPGVRWVEAPSTRVWSIQFDQGSPELRSSDIKGRNPFADRRVRQALYQGIDVERLVAVWFGGHGLPRGMMVPPQVNGFDPELDHRPPPDLGKARALLAEAGYPDGFSVKMSTSDPPWPIDRSIKDGLAPLGIRVEFAPVSDLEFIERAMAGTVDMCPLVTTSTSFDSGETLRDWYYSGRGLYTKMSHYQNPEVDRLIEQIDTEIASYVRDALIERAWRTVLDDIVNVPLFQEVQGWVARDWLDLPIDMRVIPDFRLARFAGPSAH